MAVAIYPFWGGVQAGTLAPVATSGAYSDLAGTPDEANAVAQSQLLGGVEWAIDIAGQAARAVSGGRVELTGGSAADPALRIGNAGIYQSASNTLSVAIAGVERLRITSGGITVYGTVTTV